MKNHHDFLAKSPLKKVLSFLSLFDNREIVNRLLKEMVINVLIKQPMKDHDYWDNDILLQTYGHKLTEFDISSAAKPSIVFSENFERKLIKTLINCCTSLTKLNLNVYALSNEALDQIGRLTQLQELHIPLPQGKKNPITKKGWKNFGKLPLTTLDVSKRKTIDDQALNYLQKPAIVDLNISGCKNVTYKTFEPTPQTFSALQILNVENCKGLADIAFHAIAASCPLLKELNLSNCSVTDDGFKSITDKLVGLQSLSARNTQITKKSVRQIARNLFEIRHLDLSFCTLNDGCIAEVAAKLLHLHTLKLTSTGVTNAAVMAIAFSSKYMQVLHLGHNTEVNDISIKILAEKCAGTLKEIHLPYCVEITDRSSRKLAERCKLDSWNMDGCPKVVQKNLSLARAE